MNGRTLTQGAVVGDEKIHWDLIGCFGKIADIVISCLKHIENSGFESSFPARPVADLARKAHKALANRCRRMRLCPCERDRNSERYGTSEERGHGDTIRRNRGCNRWRCHRPAKNRVNIYPSQAKSFENEDQHSEQQSTEKKDNPAFELVKKTLGHLRTEFIHQ